ncbi:MULTISPECIES: hypothetical protein [Microcoleaceae]|uniref:hypothetical protein n=1 Tax=Microcoleaceae TaxID=1892252 RepID=UPI00187FAECC|nr:hypothetical protein [Tychonema sp. LEGE 06208]MBE9162933.1 hypothetical protein [Tychonema sp. LEGE 06208]
MVCLPLVDVKFNFAVVVGRIGLFKSKYFFVAVMCGRRNYPEPESPHARSGSLGASLLDPLS